MIQYILAFGFLMFVFALMGLALHFSRYKKRASGCCGGSHCSSDNKGIDKSHTCSTEWENQNESPI